MAPQKTTVLREPTLDEQLIPRGSGIPINPDYAVNIPGDKFFGKQYWLKGGRPPSVYAMILYGWCINKTTDIVIADDGVAYGRVLGGSELSFSKIATSLEISFGAVQSNMEYLVKAGLIYRVRSSAMKEYRYFVIDCKKKFKEKPATDTVPLNLPAGTTIAGKYKGRTIYHTPPPKQLSSPPVIDGEITHVDKKPTTTSFNIEVDDCGVCGKSLGEINDADPCICRFKCDDCGGVLDECKCSPDDDDELDDDELDYLNGNAPAAEVYLDFNVEDEL